MLELAPLLVSAVILGLLGGGHCLGMCGGLMGALTLAIPKEQRSRRFRLLLAYNLGRILSYAAAGLLLGLAGWAVANSPAALFMRILAGVLLICMGLYLAGWWSGLTRIESLGRGLWRYGALHGAAHGLTPAPMVAPTGCFFSATPSVHLAFTTGAVRTSMLSTQNSCPSTLTR